MGIIADSFKATLDELMRIDEESQRKTEAILNRIKELAADLERINFED